MPWCILSQLQQLLGWPDAIYTEIVPSVSQASPGTLHYPAHALAVSTQQGLHAIEDYDANIM